MMMRLPWVDQEGLPANAHNDVSFVGCCSLCYLHFVECAVSIIFRSGHRRVRPVRKNNISNCATVLRASGARPLDRTAIRGCPWSRFLKGRSWIVAAVTGMYSNRRLNEPSLFLKAVPIVVQRVFVSPWWLKFTAPTMATRSWSFNMMLFGVFVHGVVSCFGGPVRPGSFTPESGTGCRASNATAATSRGRRQSKPRD